jgi:hypothetical protein
MFVCSLFFVFVVFVLFFFVCLFLIVLFSSFFFKNGLTIYDLRVTTTDLRPLVKRSIASSLKEREQKIQISKHVPGCVIFTHFRRSFRTSYPYLPKVTRIKSQLDMIFSQFPSVNKLFIFTQ